MVLISAGIFTKSGKRLIARCFVDDVTRARLEGLLDAFPKLIGNDKSSAQRQHTFIETDSVRYVFHPLDNIYVVLITTKNSNILEDLETLRLFSRVIPEYCRTIDEKEIFSNCFNLIHAFDEIVTLGYRESVNLAQIRTFTEMDSHEERVFMQIKEAQEKAAKDAMAEKAKDLKRQQREALTKGLKAGGSSFSSSASMSSSSTPLTAVQEPAAPKIAPSRTLGSGKAMKLGAKTHNEDEFLSQLAKQGQAIAPVERTPRDSGISAVSSAPISNVKREAVHIKCEEKLMASVSRDGALQSGELFGTASLSVSSPEFNTVAIQMKNNAPEGVTIQTHPNLEKKDWLSSSLLKLKSANKPFPVNQDVGVLKWRITLAGEDQLPLTLNCWPQENPDGCQVNIEYTLQREDLALENVTIAVPLPPSTAPVVSECEEGNYTYVRPRNQLLWTIPTLDSSNANSTLEFTVPNGHADHFFPVQIQFHSENLFAQLIVEGAEKMDTKAPVTYSTESRLLTDKYEIV